MLAGLTGKYIARRAGLGRPGTQPEAFSDIGEHLGGPQSRGRADGHRG